MEKQEQELRETALRFASQTKQKKGQDDFGQLGNQDSHTPETLVKAAEVILKFLKSNQ